MVDSEQLMYDVRRPNQVTVHQLFPVSPNRAFGIV